MTDTPAPRRALWLLPLLLIAALAAAGLWLWQWQQAQQMALADLRSQIDSLTAQSRGLSTKLADAREGEARASAALAGFAARLDTYDHTLGELGSEVEAVPRAAQLAVVEALLLTAAERAQLAHDAASARVALELADQRLARLKEPRLFALRESLRTDIAALAAVPSADPTAAALSLAALIARVPRLPLAAEPPNRISATPVEDTEPGLIAAMRRALASVFVLRRQTTPVAPLLDAEGRALVEQVLLLRLEALRVAVLRADGRAVRELTGACANWLSDYYRAADPGVQAAQADLTRLAAMPFDAELPELTRSLTLLRAQLQPAPR